VSDLRALWRRNSGASSFLPLKKNLIRSREQSLFLAFVNILIYNTYPINPVRKWRYKVAEAKEKVKKDKYQKSIEAYSQAMKAFRKGDTGKTTELLKAFLEKHTEEKELVDRVNIYLKLCEERKKAKTEPLDSFDDYYQDSIYKINKNEQDEAMKSLDKAAQLKPKEAKIPYLMAVTAIRSGNADECLEYLKKAVKLDKFFGILAQNESDFESIREKKEFKVITGTG
jgi:tetratricopeptide (TPR) repeat protein